MILIAWALDKEDRKPAIFVCGVRADCFRGLPSSMNELQPAELFPPLPLAMLLDDDWDADRETLDTKKQNKTFKANMKKAGG